MDTQLEVDSVMKMYGETTILADVYLSCVPGDIIGLFGRNGTGKSTLLRIIFGSLKGDRSCIRINGKIQKKAAYRSDTLQRWFNVKFTINDTTLLKYSFTLESGKSSLDEILNEMEKVSPIQFIPGKDTITVSHR